MKKQFYTFIGVLLSFQTASAQVSSVFGTDQSLLVTPRGITGRISGTLSPSNLYFGGRGFGSGGTGTQNTGIGSDGSMPLSGANNVMVGTVGGGARVNFSGSENILIGTNVFGYIEPRNTAINGNVIIGYNAFTAPGTPFPRFTASYTTAVGAEAMRSTNESTYNTAIGAEAFSFPESGSPYTYGSTGINSVAYGVRALGNHRVGNDNVAYGNKAMEMSLGTENCTAIGYLALNKNVANGRMTAIGRSAMENTEANASGINSYNVAIGYMSLANVLSTGTNNVAIGRNALLNTSSGSSNTAAGFGALINNTTGAFNIGIGSGAAADNTTGTDNVAIGYKALAGNNINTRNVAVGYEAMRYADSRTGAGIQAYNTAVGYKAMRGSTTAANNTGENNVAIGDSVLVNVTSGSFNTVVGAFAGNNITTGYNNTVIGYEAEVPSGISSNQVRIGNSAISYAGVQVPWTTTSDRRLKEKIKPITTGLTFIKSLRPVMYHRTNNLMPDRELGFIAQELQEAMPQLGIPDWGMIRADDKGYLTVRYNDLIAPIISAVQEQQAQLEEGKKRRNTLTSISEVDYSLLNAQADAVLERLGNVKK
jgi:trimeric autotransporter adhesin